MSPQPGGSPRSAIKIRCDRSMPLGGARARPFRSIDRPAVYRIFVHVEIRVEGAGEVDGRRLRPDEAAPLQPRSTLRLGDTVIDVDIVSHAAMVE